MGLIDDVKNSEFIMAGINRKFLELNNDSLLPLNVVNDYNFLKGLSADAETKFKEAETKNQDANEKAQEYKEELETAEDNLEKVKEKMGFFGKLLLVGHPILSKIGTGILGVTTVALGIGSFGVLPGIGIGAAAIGAKMLGTGAYCNFSAIGKEYKRIQRMIKISKGKHALYNRISKTTAHTVDYTMDEVKRRNKDFNEFKKSVIEQSKNYKDEFKLIRAYDKLTDQQLDNINRIFGQPVRYRLRDYVKTIRDCWYYNPNGISKPCNINGITDILDLIAKGKINKIDPNNMIIPLFMNNCRIPMPGITQAPPQTQGNNQPVNNQPVNNQPVNNQPVNNQPVNNQPVNNQPVNNQPVNNQPVNNQPVNNQPVNNRPVNNQPVNNQPGNNQPGNTHQQPIPGGNNGGQVQSGVNNPVHGPIGIPGEPLTPGDNSDLSKNGFKDSMKVDPPYIDFITPESRGFRRSDFDTMLKKSEIGTDQFLAAVGYMYSYNTKDQDDKIKLTQALQATDPEKMEYENARKYAKLGIGRLSEAVFNPNNDDPNLVWVEDYAKALRMVIDARLQVDANKQNDQAKNI